MENIRHFLPTWLYVLLDLRLVSAPSPLLWCVHPLLLRHGRVIKMGIGEVYLPTASFVFSVAFSPVSIALAKPFPTFLLACSKGSITEVTVH